VVLTYIHSSVRNQQESPLLRLPAEIRNAICELVLGGLRLHVICVPPRWARSCHVAARDENTQSGFKELHKLTALTLVCRQLYAETNILPFKLNSVYIFSDTFHHLATALSDQQRNAISTIRIYFYVDRLPRSDLAYMLAQLCGLKCDHRGLENMDAAREVAGFGEGGKALRGRSRREGRV
jgi:hypothetical protein